MQVFFQRQEHDIRGVLPPRIFRGSETTQGVLATRLGPLADPMGWSFPGESVKQHLCTLSAYVYKTRLVVGEVCGYHEIVFQPEII